MLLSCIVPYRAMEEPTMDKCPACGSLNDLFASSCYKCKGSLGGGVKTQTLPAEMCQSCHKPLPRCGTCSRTCMNCGWDNERNMRRCMHCSGPVVFNQATMGESRNGGAEAGWAGGGVLVAIGGRAAGKQLGYALGLTGMGILFGLVIGLGTLYRAVFTHYRCTMCRKDADLGVLTVAERKSLARCRTQYFLLTAAMGAIVLVCLLARMGNLGV